MKKLCLAAITSLLLPNMSYAAACADGANALGCTISTSDITYTLTGNITTAGDNTYGLSLASSNSNTTNLTGNITTTGTFAYGLSLASSNSNTTNLTGNITTTGGIGHGLWLFGSDSNTINLTGNISTTGDGSFGKNNARNDGISEIT